MPRALDIVFTRPQDLQPFPANQNSKRGVGGRHPVSIIPPDLPSSVVRLHGGRSKTHAEHTFGTWGKCRLNGARIRDVAAIHPVLVVGEWGTSISVGLRHYII